MVTLPSSSISKLTIPQTEQGSINSADFAVVGSVLVFVLEAMSWSKGSFSTRIRWMTTCVYKKKAVTIDKYVRRGGRAKLGDAKNCEGIIN